MPSSSSFAPFVATFVLFCIDAVHAQCSATVETLCTAELGCEWRGGACGTVGRAAPAPPGAVEGRTLCAASTSLSCADAGCTWDAGFCYSDEDDGNSYTILVIVFVVVGGLSLAMCCCIACARRASVAQSQHDQLAYRQMQPPLEHSNTASLLTHPNFGDAPYLPKGCDTHCFESKGYYKV